MAAAPRSLPDRPAACRRTVYDHVAFDLDGTLVDSRDDLVAAVNHVLGGLGLPAQPAATLVGYVGEGARLLVQRALGPGHEHRLPEALAAFMAYYGAHLLDATRPYPGIPEALAELAERGVALSVLTNKPVRMSVTILDGLGLAERFVEVIGGDSLPTRKPDPAGLAALRARTGTTAARTLLVGDSAIDLRTARAGGTAFCGVAWGLAPASLVEARPERVVERPADLVSVVDGR